MRHPNWLAVSALVATFGGLAAGCIETPDENDDRFPMVPHDIFPTVSKDEGHIASGVVTGEALEQPIAFTHKRHVEVLKMECEFCHSEARKSIHAGVPPVQTCVNCHQYVLKDNPEIQRIFEYYDAGVPIPWQKVHDLPDYVHFSHKRHVRGGVDCTECHGQVALMEGQRVQEVDSDGNVLSERVIGTMTRESTLQMGWCLDCHGSHPSINENYGELADLRRAELKDCWTCHK